MKLYAVTDKYIDYLRQFEHKVYDNKEDRRKVMRKYLGIVLTINEMNYYIPMSSPKKSDYKDNQIRKSIVPIVRIVSNEEIMNDYTNYIYTIIRNYNTNLSNEDIEEIILDVFLTLWKNQSKLDINKYLSSYIAGITKNLIKYKSRQNKNELNIDDYEADLFNLKNIDLFLIQDEKNKIIAEQLQLLKQKEKDIFILYYYNDMKVKDISKSLNISSSNVKIVLFRIRKKLKKALKDRGYGSNE